MMRYITLLGFFMQIFLVNAQVTDPKKVTKDAATNKVNNNINDDVNEGLDKAESSIKGIFKKKKKTGDANPMATDSAILKDHSPTVSDLRAYSKYDFVPGDKVIFQDDLKDEKEGEVPSQFIISGGQGQIFSVQGDKVFQTLAENTWITPRIKGMAYLSDQFTVEFDAFIEGSGDEVEVKFGDNNNEITFYSKDANYNNSEFTGKVPESEASKWYPEVNHYAWRHYAIAVNKNLLKAYIDQFRVLNVPNFNIKPENVSFSFTCSSGGQDDCQTMFLKNFRIAAGGIDLYKKVEMDGKIITHGITFDIDQASIKPESMGTINSIYELLKGSSSLKFEIDGHTDNSGSASHNLELSQARAEAVKRELLKMGVAADRLTTKGLGDSKPLTENNTPEGKANNRRVEFIKD